jgi:hypothetical protein
VCTPAFPGPSTRRTKSSTEIGGARGPRACSGCEPQGVALVPSITGTFRTSRPSPGARPLGAGVADVYDAWAAVGAGRVA